MIHHQGACFIALFCTSPEDLLMKRPKKWTWTSSVHLQNIFWWSVQQNEPGPLVEILWRRSNTTRQIQYGVAYIAEFFMLDDITEVSDDLWYYVRSFERHDCNYVLCFGIDVKCKNKDNKENWLEIALFMTFFLYAFLT
jgi:hypothetical protein